LTFAEIEKELIAGAIDFGTLVWREGMDEWLEIGQVPELQGIEPPTRIVLAPPAHVLAAAAPPAAPIRAKAPSAPTLDPKADLPKVDLPKPRPPAPTMSGIGQPPPPPPTPSPEIEAPPPSFPPPPAFPSAPVFPTPPAAPPAAEPVMVPAPAIAAAFATPVQSSPSAKAPPIARGPSAAGVPEWPEERKNRAPLILGIIVVLLLIGGGLYALKSMSDDKLPPPTPITALPPTTPPATPPSTPSEAAAAAAAPAPGTAQAAAATSRSALDPPGGSLSATPNAGFAELFANGARNADEKKGPAGQRFDPNVANRALAAAAFETAKCKEAGGPTGMATVMVTFDPSGKVASATVSDAPFAGTSSGACIAATMKRATVPPFSGLPGTATKIISIQ